jgi:DNA polymerase
MTDAAPVLLDFESRSRADLKATGGRNYWAHPSTEALCCCWHDTRGGADGCWIVGEPWPHRGRVLAAHNATGFDRHGATRYGFGAADWIDASELARRAGLPAALDALGTRWLGVPKDDDGSRFTRALSSVRRPASVTAAAWKAMPDDERRACGAQPTLDAAAFVRIVNYCASDVAIMRGAWPRLAPWADLGADEADVLRVDRVVNDRGVALDCDLLRGILECDEANAEAAVETAARALGWSAARVREVAGSPAQCAEALGVGDARKATLRDVAHPLVSVRQALASIIRGKCLAGLARVSPDGRLRDAHQYYGGHTGRWSGRGMQLQNLPRPANRFEKWTDADICRAADGVLAGGAADAETLAVLLRAAIFAPPGKALAVCDFSGVEARALAWCAGDRDALEVFASGRNPYYVAAALIFGCDYGSISKGTLEYSVGKIAELALGYGQGARKFVETARVMGGVDLEAAGLDAAEIVAAWRRQHAPTVRFWYACERAWRAAAEGRASSVGCFDFAPGSEDELAVFLPSGRPVVYPEPRIGSDGGCVYHGTGEDPKALIPVCGQHFGRLHGVVKRCLACGVAFEGKRRTCPACRGSDLTEEGACEVCGVVLVTWRTHIYGGKIVENLIQALCRDLMADALVRAEVAGLVPVMTVHDEIVCEADETLVCDTFDFLRHLMCDVPFWASGFPVGAAGFTGRRYRK